MKEERVSTTLNKIARSVFVAIAVVILKIVLFDLISGSSENESLLDRKTVISFQYRVVTIDQKEYDFGKPEFDQKILNEYVDDYIEKYACTTLEYDIKELDDSKINIFLNCGTPVNAIFDYQSETELPFKSIVDDYASFMEQIKKLFLLKYPKFVLDTTDFEGGAYDIKNSEIKAYYSNEEFGDVTLKINNNEIRDMMSYEMVYDDAYENEVYTLDPNKKTIAFTFDDGPSNYDVDIIDSLVSAHASATFYLVGNRMQSYPKSISYMIDNSMEVGNHTYDHKSLVGLTDEQIKEEVTKTDDLFFELTGQRLTSLRPSYGAINSRVQRQIGLPIILWDIDTLDWKTRDAEKISETILSEAHDGAIVLMHSLYPSTKEAVDRVLPALYKEGYQVVSVGKLAELKGFELTAGMTVSEIKNTKDLT